jgi:hypothetical protein
LTVSLASDPRREHAERWVAAALCALFFGLHAYNHARRGNPWDAFWSCHWATLMIGGAALSGSARWNSIGLVWLAVGDTLWLVDLVGYGAWMWTSALTHLGGLAVGVWSARRLGYAPGSWWRALLALVAWQRLTALFTPPERNINLAFAIHPSSRAYFASYALYWVSMLALGATLMLTAELVYRRWFRIRRPG